MALGRWGCLHDALPAEVISTVRPFGHVTVQPVDFQPDRAAYLAGQLREWGPTFVQCAPDANDARLFLEGAVTWLDGVAHAMDAPRRNRAEITSGTACYTGMQLVQALLLSRLVKDSRSLHDVVVGAFRLVLPSFADYVQRSFDEHDGSCVPSAATVSRSRVVLDVAWLILQHVNGDHTLRFGMADSSPQKGHDWLLSAVDEIKLADVVPCFRAFNALVMVCGRRELGEPYDEETSGVDHEVLFRGVCRTTPLPVALGHGATNLSYKVAALVFAWSCGRRRQGFRFPCQARYETNQEKTKR